MFRWTICVLLACSCIASFAEEGNMITFSAGSLRLGFGASGQVESLLDVEQEKEYFAAGQAAPLLSLVVSGKQVAPTSLSYDEGRKQLSLTYGDAKVTATVAVDVKPSHVTFELKSVEGAIPERIEWGPFPTTIGQTVGSWVGVVRDDRFALGIQSLNIQTDAGAAWAGYGSLLQASAIEHDGGLLGAKIALFGCPAERALVTIGKIEVDEGLPHPMLDGVWGKLSPTAGLSYLVTLLAEDKMDQIIDVATRGGFRYVYDPNPFKTWGHFELDPTRFPDGDESLRRCVEKAAKHGIRLGCHTLTAFITTNDPYVTPVPDPRLARLGSTALATAVDGMATEIPVADPEPFRAKQQWGWHIPTAILGSEIIQYAALSETPPWRLLGCSRGLFGTTASAHEAGADIGRLATHAYKTLYPGIDNGMVDEMSARLVELGNKTGLRQISFDGLEGLWDYGHGRWAAVRFVKQCFDGWTGEVMSDSSGGLHYLWHIHSRMNWGELTLSAGMDVDNYRANNCRFFEDNLFPKALGWWRLNPAGMDWEATRLEDIEYLLAKAAGWGAAHAAVAELPHVESYGYSGRLLEMTRNWDEARYLGAFTEAQRTRLCEKGRRFHLEPTGDRQWALKEAQYSPFYWLCPGTGRTAPPDPERQVLSFTTAGEEHLGTACPVANPFAAQPMRFELRTLGSLDYDHPDNIPLTPATAAELRRLDAPPPDSGDLLQGGTVPLTANDTLWGFRSDAPVIQVTDTQVSGQKGYEIATRWEGGDKPSWVTRVIATLPKPLDLSQHRGLGVWVRGDGKGELLFLELTSGDRKRQYYVPITFTGERYFEFPIGEMCSGRYYSYDWNHWSGFASWWVTLKNFDYRRVDRLTVGFNAIPPGQEVRCAVAGVRALRELGHGLRNPTLELGGRRMSFADTLPPGAYLIYQGGDKAEVRDANYGLLREVPVSGDRLQLGTGENVVQVSYEGDGGPAPWSRWEFESLGPPEKVAVPTRPQG